jgi:hypothetical protein
MRLLLTCLMLSISFLVAQPSTRLYLRSSETSILAPEIRAYMVFNDNMLKAEDGSFLKSNRLENPFDAEVLLRNRPEGVVEAALKSIGTFNGVWYKGVTETNGKKMYYYAFFFSCGAETCVVSGGTPTNRRKEKNAIVASLESLQPNILPFENTAMQVDTTGWLYAGKHTFGDILAQDDMDLYLIQRPIWKGSGDYFVPNFYQNNYEQAEDKNLMRWLFNQHLGFSETVFSKREMRTIANLPSLVLQGTQTDANSVKKTIHAAIVYKNQTYHALILTFPEAVNAQLKTQYAQRFEEVLRTFRFK